VTKLVTAKRITATAALALTVTTLALTGAAVAGSTPASSGIFSPAASRLRATVLHRNEVADFTPVNCPAVQDDAADWAATDTAAIPALRNEGFQLGISEQLYSPRLHAGGTSVVAKFRTAIGARNDMERQINSARNSGDAATFPVAGIPDAAGSTFSANGATGYQIAFTVGSYEYLISVSFPDNQLESYPAPAETQLFTAAHVIYQRAINKK
jgi:hypothetical protein